MSIINYQIIRASDYAEIKLSGVFGNGEGQISAKQFMSDFENMAKIYGTVKINMNSAGGSVQEGMEMYNAIKKSNAVVETYCSGIVASMASAVFMAGSKRTMAVGSRMMIHQANVMGLSGNAEDLKDAAQALEGINADLKAIYISATGQSDKTVSGWMARGKNTWFNATECKKLNLCDGIDEHNKMGISIAFEPDAYKMVAEFNQLLIPKIPEMDKKLITVALALSEAATDAEIMAGIQNLKNKMTAVEAENATLKANAALVQKSRVTALVEDAVTAGKITAEQKGTFETLAIADFDATKKAIEGIKTSHAAAQPSMTAMVQAAQMAGMKFATGEKTYSQLAKENPEALETMHKHDFEKFSALYKAEYGVTPEKY